MDINNICEIFNSIQGEGFEIGMPATFIRFNRCNKQCLFCDTNFKTELDPRDLQPKFLNNIIFTGGEPFLFIEDIKKIMKKYPTKAFYGETNGSIFEKYLAKNITWAISPKSSNDLDTAKSLLEKNSNSYIKLIYGTPNFSTIFDIVKDFNCRITIQPLTVGDKFLNLQDTINFAADNNLYVSCRLHLLWGLK